METVNQVRIFLSSPSDLKEERQSIKEYIHNHVHIDGYTFDVVLWEDRMPSTTTTNAQQDINKVLLEPSDMLIGIFKSKFGKKTKSAPSGTVEEIEECIANSKPVMLYFLEHTVTLSKSTSDDLENLKKIREFQDMYKDRGVYAELPNLNGIFQRLQNDIKFNLNKIIQQQTVPLESIQPLPAKSKTSTGEKHSDQEPPHIMNATVLNNSVEIPQHHGPHSKWYMQCIADSINTFLKSKGIDYNYRYNLTFHENLLLAQGSTSVFTASSLKELFNNARSFAFDEKYGNYDYKNDLRSKYTNWSRPILKLIKQKFGNCKKLRLIDVGGNSGEEISEIFGNKVPTSVTLLDLSSSALSKAEKNFPEFKCLQANMEEEYPISESFDICLCLRSIQSTGVSKNDALIQMSNIVKPNGLIIITIPNGYLDENSQVIRGMFDYKTNDFNISKPLSLSSKIESKLRAYGFHDTDIMTLETEIMIWGTKNDNQGFDNPSHH